MFRRNSNSKERKRSNSPARKSEFPDRQFQFSEAAKKKLEEFAANDHTKEEEDDDVLGLHAALQMDREEVLARYGGPSEIEETGRLRDFDTPSPESLAYMKALENPMAARSSMFEKEFEDLLDTPEANDTGSIPSTSPPAYSITEEGIKHPQKSSAGSIPHRSFSQGGKQNTRGFSSSSSGSETSSSEGKEFANEELEVMTYVDKFKADSVDHPPKLQSFDIEYQASLGEVDLFLRVPRPDEIDDNAGLTFFDEPLATKQTDAAVVEMQIRNTAKDSTVLGDAVPMKVLPHGENQKERIIEWIAQMKEHHKQKPPIVVRRDPSMPTVEQLMRETPPQLQHMRAVPAELDVSLEEYIDLNLNLLDIPVINGNRIEGVKLLFQTLMEVQKHAHFRNFVDRQESQAGEGAGKTETKTERLEL